VIKNHNKLFKIEDFKTVLKAKAFKNFINQQIKPKKDKNGL